MVGSAETTAALPVVLVYADRPLLLQAAVGFLRSQPGIGPVFAADSPDAVLDHLDECPDLLVIWAAHGHRTLTLEVLRASRQRQPELSTLLIGADAAGLLPVHVLIDSAVSVVDVDQSCEALLAAIQQIAKGNVVLPVELARSALREVSAAGRPTGSHLEGILTPRELGVVRLLGDGLDRRAIARQLQVSGNTLRSHLGHIMSKLDMHSEVELAAAARGGDVALRRSGS